MVDINKSPIQKPADAENLEIFNEDNPYSLVNKVPEYMIVKLYALEKDEVDWLSLTTTEIREKIKPTSIMNRLRMAFWNEYENACRTGDRMETKRIYAGICSMEHFSRMMQKVRKYVWLIQPVPAYQDTIEELLLTGTEEMRKILEAPIYKEDGSINTSLVNSKLKLQKMIEDRALGAVAQKLETKSLNVNANLGKDGEVKQIDVDEELKKLRNQVNENENIKKPEVVDVEVREVKENN